jgi:surfactin synthase thioesterase subunit
MRRPNKSTTIPALYLCATQDRLVAVDKFAEFKRCFENIKLVDITGPHMILATRPDDCVQAIHKMLSGIKPRI